MALADAVSGAGRPNLYVSRPESGRAETGDRATQLAKRLDQRLTDRLEQIRAQMHEAPQSPNTENTGSRLDILA